MSTDLNRRRIALTAVALAAASTTSATAEVQASSAIEIEAPDDVFVLSVASSATVAKPGDLLFSLKSYRLIQLKNRLDLFGKQIEFAERPFKDGRIDEEIKSLKDKAANLSTIQKINSHRLQSANLAVQLGLLNPWVDHTRELNDVNSSTTGNSDGQTHTDSTGSTDGVSNAPVILSSTSGISHGTSNGSTVSNSTTNQIGAQSTQNSKTAEKSDSRTLSKETSTTKSTTPNPQYMTYEDVSIAAAQADNLFQDAQLLANQADRKRQEALDKIALSKDRLTVQQQILSELLATMNIKAATSGKFIPLALAGSFVKKGHLLGRLEL